MPVTLGRNDLLAVGLELRLQPEHDRHVRPVHVAVEQRDAAAALRERDREVDRDRRLADAALAGADGDDVLDALHRRAARAPAAPTARTCAVISMSTRDTPRSADTAARA